MNIITDLPTLSIPIFIIIFLIIFGLFNRYKYKDTIKTFLSFITKLCLILLVLSIILFITRIKNIHEGTLESQKEQDQIFFFPQFPQYNDSTHQFECTKVKIDNTVLQDKSSNITIAEQIAAIFGLLFTVAIYGITSKFNFRNTCIVDDLLILTCLLVPIISWFFITKTVYVFGYNHNYPDALAWRDLPFINALINIDFLSLLADFIYILSSFWLLISYYQPFYKIKNPLGEPQPTHFIRKRLFFFVIFISIIECFFEYNGDCTTKVTNAAFYFIITTVITRSVSSFFSTDKNFKVELYLQVDLDTNEEELKIIEDIQRIYLKKPTERSEEFKKVYEKIRQIISNQECINGEFNEEKLFGKDIGSDSSLIIKEIIRNKLMKAKDKIVLDDGFHWLCNNHILGTKFIAEKLIENTVGVHINVLETGIFQYLTYSHRSVVNTNSRNIKIKKDDSEYKIIIREGRIKWIIIPAISEVEDYSIDNSLMVEEISNEYIGNHNDDQINYLKHLIFVENLLGKKAD
ncbi:26499_t:CDS:2 [Dentiscutata erythropus]|uniref:26499_t:CDS:1 n=1 Tax=Dentiscutata erythropus TaxID=1348616 RepID=A0A9N8YRT9_9GLOM|nr:26499_t:CDS:2 [Dentiscutata erythropus]